MVFGYLVVALLSAAATIFALQNVQPATVRFLFWSIDNVPLAGAILVSLAAGVVLAGVPMSIERWRWQSRAKALQTRVEILENALGDRAAAPLNQRPAGAAVREVS